MLIFAWMKYIAKRSTSLRPTTGIFFQNMHKNIGFFWRFLWTLWFIVHLIGWKCPLLLEPCGLSFVVVVLICFLWLFCFFVTSCFYRHTYQILLLVEKGTVAIIAEVPAERSIVVHNVSTSGSSLRWCWFWCSMQLQYILVRIESLPPSLYFFETL